MSAGKDTCPCDCAVNAFDTVSRIISGELDGGLPCRACKEASSAQIRSSALIWSIRKDMARILSLISIITQQTYLSRKKL